MAEPKNNLSHPINERIRNSQIRVIDSDGSLLGIMTPREALRIAQEKDLDLVMVNDKAEPPVCRIMNYGKYKYEKEKAAKNHHKAEIKELKMRYKIEEHDYQVRVNHAQRFLKAGDMVKATITFQGREIQHSDLAQTLLNKMAEDLQEFGQV